MARRRYQRPDALSSDNDLLPLDTTCTILTRQSTMMQRERSLFSAEVNPRDLIREAERLGFASERIQVLDWDMGKGAYNTTIEDRPALHHWLTVLLPSGASRVVLVSQEDRLFRDRTEIQVNRFIEQVARQGGWVVCGARVYNFRREMDKEQFRLACKYGKQYIEFHIKGRLHPARHRAALAGRHVGGPVPWGYIVDYEPRSARYMHYVRYEPHARLVLDQVFRRFANMAQPSTAELARIWRREGLVFPRFGADVDPRRVRWVEAHCRRDEALGGYALHRKMAAHILTEVAYLGWRARAGDVALDEHGQPRMCHEPLVEPDLFWWCYDLLQAERPEWAPARPLSAPKLVAASRTLRPRADPPGVVRFLVPGRVRCAVHGRRYSPVERTHGRRTQLFCTSEERELSAGGLDCPILPAAVVEEALCAAFTEHLTLDDGDARELARIAEERAGRQGDELERVRRQIAEQEAVIERARRRALQVDDDGLAAGFLVEMREAKRQIGDLEARLREVRHVAAPSAVAWRTAERAIALADRIRSTFADWPREAQQRVLVMALAEGVLGRVSRRVVGLWMRWEGGAESRREIACQYGERIEWTEEEVQALRRWYGVLTWDALCAMLPARTSATIARQASRLGLRRERLVAGAVAEPPAVITVSGSPNGMAGYGFPLDTLGQTFAADSLPQLPVVGVGAGEKTEPDRGTISEQAAPILARPSAPSWLLDLEKPGTFDLPALR